MRDRWRGLTSSSPAAIIHALHWASGASPFSARALPFLSLRDKLRRSLGAPTRSSSEQVLVQNQLQ